LAVDADLERKEKFREYYAKYRAINREKIRKRNLKWYNDNREKCLESGRKYRLNNLEKNRKRCREYARNHKEKNKAYKKIWEVNNRDKVNATARKSKRKNHEKVIACMKKWRSEHKKEISDYSNKYMKRRREQYPSIKILGNLRTKMRIALKSNGTEKKERTVTLIDCTPNELKIYLELLFKPGMSWDNYGRKGWHIDHIIPCAIFDLTDKKQRKKCFHYTNLQPLWAQENLKKGKQYYGC